ncbi:Cytochrome c-555 [Burkholderiales bacterium]|nr:Cytochrome c-555 [Burkholderiales bacterium]
MTDHDPHSSPIKTPKQLIIVVVLAFVVPIVLIVLITQLVTGGAQGGGDDSAVLARIAPVGTVQIGAGTTTGAAPAAATAATPAAASAAAPAAAPAAAAPAAVAVAAAPAAVAAAPAANAGKKTYDTACVACHGMGIAGAPKFGDKGAWSARIAQGANTLYDHAIKGFTGKGGVMPPKGGAMALTDADVRAAVDYMAAAAK